MIATHPGPPGQLAIRTREDRLGTSDTEEHQTGESIQQQEQGASEWSVSEMRAGSSDPRSEWGPPSTAVLDSHKGASQERGEASGIGGGGTS